MAIKKNKTTWNAAVLVALATSFQAIQAQPAATEDDTLIIIDETGQPAAGEEETIIIEGPSGDGKQTPSSTPAQDTGAKTSNWSLGLDQARVEAGHYTDSGSPADSDFYGNVTLMVHWNPSEAWELQAAPRLDGYRQGGDLEWERLQADYGDSFVRWRSGSTRVTAGAQTVIWGRIDELPPSDRLGVQDLSRGVIDKLTDRRRATPLLRVEHHFADAKLDLVWLPAFRGAELPDQDSVWYPLNRRTGEAFGLHTTPALATVIRTTPIEDEAPDGDGGFGARLNVTKPDFDFALTVQNNRQSTPYYRFDPTHNLLVAEYPRSWLLGGDLGFEAAGATWRLEAVYLSDIPVTDRYTGYTTVEGINWGAGVELYPGDGNTRVNLQLVGTNLLDAPDILDRKDPLVFNGSLYMPFAHDRWSVDFRFFVGLDEHDLYLNPKLTFHGWEPHQLYLQLHWFEGAEGTLGGYYRNNTLISAGWRAEF